NDFASPPGSGLKQLADRIPHLQSLGVNAVYLGPLFESAAHGYDTVDYWHVDRRLGTDADLAALVRSFHDAGIAVVLDAVLNHTGRDFFAFRDLRLHRLTALVLAPNVGSARLLEKVGFRYEGTRRKDCRLRRRWYDVAVYGLLAREWAGPPARRP
ncbi:MAG TPA: alpha-amylase family glycosyl hydrolase, partial [candidate division Zixibacteria bacterium]|nr:alpha-amylase family glycosyl hydrolase [candidate division Zixibacteria bacterium]